MSQRLTTYLQIGKLQVVSMADEVFGRSRGLTSLTMLASPGVPKYRLSIRSPVLNRRWRATAARVVDFDLFCSL